QLAPTGTPPNGQSEASAVYDEAHHIMIVFGGSSSTVLGSNQVSILTHLGGIPQWQTIAAEGAAGSPAKRFAHAAIYDATHNRMTIFAGNRANANGFPEFNDAWVLTNANGSGGTPSWIN